MKLWTVSLVALTLATAHVAVAQGTTIDTGSTYRAGSRVASPLAGISFELPTGVQLAWEPTLGGLLGGTQDGLFLGVWGWSEGTPEEVGDELEARLSQQGVRLAPRGEPEVLSDGFRGSFDAYTDDGPGVLSAEVHSGPHGNVVAIAALGPRSAPADATAELVRRVSGSVQWSEPLASSWRREAEGAVLAWSGGGSDISSGTTTGTGASQSSATLALCGRGQYRYSESSETYVSIPGASASSSSSDEHAGQWWLVADLAGTATLVLEATDGREFHWSVEEAGDAYLIDGYRYTPSGSC